MVVITMLSTCSILKKLKSDNPTIDFQPSDDYLWSPNNQTVYYSDKSSDKDGYAYLLHELSHGLLEHTDYDRDVTLIAMERAAWDKAQELASKYDLKIGDELIESNLDSYRDWMHSRSTCPNCDATGLQIKKLVYNCPACGHNWRVNEARVCALRRFSI
jgi:ribosomal protein L37AE/L43A